MHVTKIKPAIYVRKIILKLLLYYCLRKYTYQHITTYQTLCISMTYQHITTCQTLCISMQTSNRLKSYLNYGNTMCVGTSISGIIYVIGKCNLVFILNLIEVMRLVCIVSTKLKLAKDH